MPCEGCQMQFTVFRRKRTCTDCKRYYCSNCLTIGSPKKTTAQLIHGSNTSSIAPLCERCAIFAKRPLLYNDLQQLKPKDLIFYLQSQHISTAGCVEKDELISLVLNHIQEKEASAALNGDNRSANSSSTSFRNIKQTCQNFFNNITENIQETFSAFEDANNTKCGNETTPTTTPTTTMTSTAATPTTHITTDQPRVSTRVLPTYASMQRNDSSPISSSYSNDEIHMRDDSNENSHSNSNNNNKNNNNNSNNNRNTNNNNEHDSPIILDELCLCLEDDDEEDNETKKQKKENSAENIEVPCKINIENGFDENSSQSSFEELGAIGGLSDESKTPADSNSGNSSNLEQWHIFDACPTTSGSNQQPMAAECAVNVEATSQPEHAEPATTSSNNLNVGSEQIAPTTARQKKIHRHHSESYLQLKRKAQQSLDDDEPSTSSGNKQRISCKRCGKRKSSLKQHVNHMRQFLQSAQMSEADIKVELSEFLRYLENRTNSMDEDESMEVAISVNPFLPDDDVLFLDDNAGIHVYGIQGGDNDNGSNVDKSKPRRFINLEDYDSLKQLECLSVKQLKEVLMLNRVDYKGCVEKHELLDRVERLWKNLKATPALDQLPTDELCKICMDAPIECVILECGHMATCTNCGKVLSECPICRQYIVRVVRFFRA